jgi:hypothetical protein
MHEETPYHENTKVRKHERGEGYIEQSVVFRAFVMGFDNVFPRRTTDNGQRTTSNLQQATSNERSASDDGPLTMDN